MPPNARIVRLLDPPELTPRQLAQRKYQQSAKGKAALARYREKVRHEPAYKARTIARVRAWEQANRIRRLVYKRVWDRTAKRLKLAA